ncbi:MAG TPA: hypothetical protein VNQ73_01355 [Ilumatobacter sp.]|nr:hypothetical protein [Ilumatobacter sp.]
MGTDPAWDAAVELYGSLQRGDALPLVSSPVALDPSETARAYVPAWGWRFHGVDVAYTEHCFLALGGLAMFGLTAAATAAGNRRARAEAERLAAPQWRPLGELPILATDRRLLVFHESAWASVWLAGVRELVPSPDERQLVMHFDDDPPYGLCGPWVPYLTVVVSALLGLTAPPIPEPTPARLDAM